MTRTKICLITILALTGAAAAQSPQAAVDLVTVTIERVLCNEPVSNGALDHGDNIWLTWHAQVFNAAGATGRVLKGATPVYGNRADSRVATMAGGQSDTGGIGNGSVLGQPVGNQPSRTPGLPMRIGQFSFVQGQNALVIVPVIWRAHGPAGQERNPAAYVPLQWDAHVARLHQSSVEVRSWISERPRTDFMLSQNINRVSDGRWWQLDWMCSSSSTYAEVPDNCDRPIGSRAGLGRGTSRFIPNAIVLTSAVVRALQTENPPGLIRLDYRDVGPAGDYSLFLRVRIDRTVEPETDSLGRVWEVRENGWVGTWTRRGNSKTFDAEWTAPNGQRIRDTIIIEDIQGRDIVLRRVGLNGYYKGTITPEGKRAIGTATWYPAGASWSAYIVP